MENIFLKILHEYADQLIGIDTQFSQDAFRQNTVTTVNILS
jgi:hypothetical protein